MILISALVCSLFWIVSASTSAMSHRGDGPVKAISWSQTAQDYRGQTDDIVLYCSENGQFENVWGSDVYADDSSICSAAVHGGLITVADGGAIAIRLLPGQPRYVATTQNGVTSESWGSWFGSFTFTTLHDPIAGTVTVNGQSVPIQIATWQTTATQFSEREGDAIAFYCPPNGEIGSLWGTDIYRDASSVCSAAVHDSRLMTTDGGVVALIMGMEQARYQASTRQGVISQSSRSVSPSFRFTSFQNLIQ
ncbi:MAG: LCCL domain-containing protein [Cyanobacteria bacterium P01_F01_bin.150]